MSWNNIRRSALSDEDKNNVKVHILNAYEQVKSKRADSLKTKLDKLLKPEYNKVQGNEC